MTVRLPTRNAAALSERMRPLRCGLFRPLSASPRSQPACLRRGLQNRIQSCDYATNVQVQFGQPLHETHPHLLSPGELTPGITALEYAERRARLAASLPPNSVAIVAAAETKYRSGAVFYKFHQDPNFLYLTGFNEPDAVAIIDKRGDGAHHTFHLFCRPKNERVERWDGTRSGVQAARDVFNADEAGDINDVASCIKKLIGRGRSVFSDIPGETKTSSTFGKLVFGTNEHEPGSIAEVLGSSNTRSLKSYIHELRATKSDAEIACMRRAGEASATIFTEAMSRGFETERELDSFLDYGFKSMGCEESAYVPVVAGGKNALQIHYVSNDNILRDGDLVTVDAGGEYGGYVTDITRAWPVNGKFSPAQSDLYAMVLEVQKSCVALCHEDADLSLDGIHGVAEVGLRDGLRRLGFDLKENALDALFPHHLGHYVGLAVHDAPGYSRTSRLKRNQTITIEPGIYVEDDDRWPKHFRGLGLRIEDSVCVGKREPFVLTMEAVKEVDAIEALRGDTA